MFTPASSHSMASRITWSAAACAVAVITLAGITDPSGVVAQSAPRGVVATKPTLRFQSAAEWVRETDGDVHVTVELSQPARTTLQVPITLGGTATPGVDYTVDSSTVTIPAGATTGDYVLHIIDDGSGGDEGAESVFLGLGGVGPSVGVLPGGLGTHTVGIAAPEQPALGDPLPYLTPDQLEAFNRGKVVFEHPFRPSEGLGPFYNATSCQSCHSTPVTGGGAALYRNFYLAVYQFGATPSSQSTGLPPAPSQVVPAFGSGTSFLDSTFTLSGPRPPIPATYLGFPVLSAQRNSIPIFGVGLFENISNATIIANADPNDLNGDGVSGRINTALGGSALGRLGMKSQSNNIELFTRAPLQNQMGITTDPFEGSAAIVSLARAPVQVSGDPNVPTTDNDGVPDPELSPDDLGDLIAYTKFLAPPIAKPFSPDALAGQALFTQVRCAECHIPALPSSKGMVKAYTDLLIHYMGPDDADNIKLGEASTVTTDFRSQPLWGISLVAPYMHDGRAPTLLDAIQMHAGEAQASHDLFMALSPTEQNQLIVFLEHL